MSEGGKLVYISLLNLSNDLVHCSKNNGESQLFDSIYIQDFSQSLDKHFHEKLNFYWKAKIYNNNRKIRIMLLNIG